MEHVILGFLNTGEMTGYDIKQLMGISTSFFYNGSYGSIYPALKRLEGAGLVKSREVTEHGRIRKIYAITDEGREEFLRWLEGPPGESRFKYDFLIKVFFFSNLPKDKIRASISRHISEIKQVLKTLEAIELAVGSKADLYQMYTLRFGKDLFEFLQGWFMRFLEDVTQAETSAAPAAESGDVAGARQKKREVRETL